MFEVMSKRTHDKSIWKARNFKPIKWKYDGGCIRCISHAYDTSGYPQFKRKKKITRIARAILLRRLGEQPKSVVCRHTCDNRWCINPDHIIPGTLQDNNADRTIRGRTASKLSKADVLWIREMLSKGYYQHDIAKLFTVDQSNISLIATKKIWRHL